MKIRSLTAVFAALAALLALTSACAGRAPEPTVKTLDDIGGKTIGVLSGSSAAVYAAAYGTIREYATPGALASDLRAGVIDCAITDEAVAPQLLKGAKGLKTLDEPFVSVDFCVAAAKESRDLLEDIDAALLTLRENGTLEALTKAYILGETYKYTPRTDIPEDAGSLRLAVSDSFPPYSQSDGRGGLRGFDIDLATAVCDLLGVRLELVVKDRGSIEKTVWSAHADFGMGGLYEKPEEDSIVCYSAGYVNCTLRVVTRK